MVRRVYIEKKEGFDTEGRRLKTELAHFLGGRYGELTGLERIRTVKRYDLDRLDEDQFKKVSSGVLYEPYDKVYYDEKFLLNKASWFGVEFGRGQYDERADAAEQCAEITAGTRPRIKIATFYIFENLSGQGPLSAGALEQIKKYLINPVDSVEASLELPNSLEDLDLEPADVAVLKGFAGSKSPEELALPYGFGMSAEDLLFCRDYFAKEGRDPTIAEMRMLDTYWSDHCRHTTFNTILEEINIEGEASGTGDLQKALKLYEETRKEYYGAKEAERSRSLMDIATIGTKLLKKKGLIPGLDESPEVNACTVKVSAEFTNGNSGTATEPWLLLFKNETHNHPTEIEPSGGANTCLGGGIRDPLSGRAHVHQAMRITGAGDPRATLKDTLPGKLPQIKIAREASNGYSSYGNSIGLAGGQVAEFYHDGFLAKRMELGALVGAVPEAWVRREEPAPGDVVILLGAKTGRDGIGGATGSSGAPGASDKKIESNGAGVPKGNAVEERKIVRLFRKAEVCRLIKRCNDFGAGGVSVAVGEIASGLDINLDAVPAKYPGLDGTELAISESQERMAVVCSAEDADKFIKLAADENLDAVIIAQVTSGNQVTAGAQVTAGDKARLRMFWRGKTIIDISREFLSTNGVPRRAKVLIKREDKLKSIVPPCLRDNSSEAILNNLKQELGNLRSTSRRGLAELFDSSNGSNTVLFPFGGSRQGTPECGMAALLPAPPCSSQNRQSRTASLMIFGYDPDLMSIDPYRGGKGAVLEALAKFACLGGDPFKAWLSMQEYFEKPVNGETWGKPAAALLGALEAQIRLGIPAIGGKDSMSGNYRDDDNGINLTVPPTLVAFAAGTCAVEKVRSGALSGKAGNSIILLSQSAAPAITDASAATAAPAITVAPAADEWEVFKANMKILQELAASGALKAAYPVGSGGVAATLAVMAFGGMTGVEVFADALSVIDARQTSKTHRICQSYQGSVLAEIDEAVLTAESLSAKLKDEKFKGGNCILAGKTLSESVYRIAGAANNAGVANKAGAKESAETSLDELYSIYEKTLSLIYPQTSIGITAAEAYTEQMSTSADSAASALRNFPAAKAGVTKKQTHLAVHAAPLVVLPVFPNTNGEWDLARAFGEAGAKTRFVIFKNRSSEETAASIKELAASIKDAEIIAFSGGYTAGNEAGGSGQFIANVLRSPAISAGIEEFLSEKDGLILGIAAGFEALVKTGLVPYGRIRESAENRPFIAANAIGRHVSRMVRTLVMPNISPWLSLEESGTLHMIPASHSKGRMVIREEEAQELFASGQVPFCYADTEGKPAMAEPDNPNGSAFAIESLCSPDGRILGKMCHSERRGEYIHINIPGKKSQKIFEAGVRYFQKR